MTRNDIQVNFRIPAELKSRLDAAARASGRSLTAELVGRLEDSFLISRPDRDDDESTMVDTTDEMSLALQVALVNMMASSLARATAVLKIKAEAVSGVKMYSLTDGDFPKD